MADEPEDNGAALSADNDTGADQHGEAPQLSETEQLAVEMGWKPEAQFTGPEGKWKPARDYIKAERDISRTMRDTVKHLRDQVDRMAAAGTKQTERALKQQADDLNRQFTEAVANKDVEGAAEAAKGMRDLEASTRAGDTDPEAVAAAIERDFSADNPWYQTDTEATEYAQFISQRELKKGIPFDKHKGTVVAAVLKRFPELAGDAPKPGKKPAELHSPSGRGLQRKERGFGDLPVDVKRAAESHARLANQRFGVDLEKAKKDYAADYWADAAA